MTNCSVRREQPAERGPGTQVLPWASLLDISDTVVNLARHMPSEDRAETVRCYRVGNWAQNKDKLFTCGAVKKKGRGDCRFPGKIVNMAVSVEFNQSRQWVGT